MLLMNLIFYHYIVKNKGLVKDISVSNYLKLLNIEKKLFGYKYHFFDKKIKYYKNFYKKIKC